MNDFENKNPNIPEESLGRLTSEDVEAVDDINNKIAKNNLKLEELAELFKDAQLISGRKSLDIEIDAIVSDTKHLESQRDKLLGIEKPQSRGSKLLGRLATRLTRKQD